MSLQRVVKRLHDRSSLAIDEMPFIRKNSVDCIIYKFTDMNNVKFDLAVDEERIFDYILGSYKTAFFRSQFAEHFVFNSILFL